MIFFGPRIRLASFSSVSSLFPRRVPKNEFSKVAASDHEKDHAWLPIVRTPEEIATAAGSNRWAGWPYTKYMVANDNIDGAAAWFMCSAGQARQLGIPEQKWS